MHADEIAETLGIARSNVSMGLKELLAWDLIQVTHTLGDRRDFFTAPHDPWEVVQIVVEGRKRREIDPTVALLRECAVALQKDTETPREVRDRIVAQMEFFETLDRLVRLDQESAAQDAAEDDAPRTEDRKGDRRVSRRSSLGGYDGQHQNAYIHSAPRPVEAPTSDSPPAANGIAPRACTASSAM